ncbi:guanylate-binding protein 5-like [Acomys russatus]|uniref:guanylate-binding protein 5-like n=1 Tax=Acomys russatus TaxID=60746 RepID=UPI0021E2C4A9|nr:guanylate-binding protein 5-like [Acomys russatus]
MATETHMPEPMCLIWKTEDQLVANEEALKILAAITEPVVVVAIVGLYRTGKSYLMNKLAGKEKGFSVGTTVQSHTKGIWMWCVPHPQKSGHTLVLLDTEGLGDVEKIDDKNDAQIFALAILFSSTFVYNTMNKIDQGAIDLLQYPFMHHFFFFVYLKSLLSAKQDEMCKKNVEASAGHCSALLQSIFKPLEQEVAQGIYAKPGGHTLFLQKMEQLKAQYHQQPGKGTQADEVLQKYLKDKEPLSNTILQTDQALTAKERQKREEQEREAAARAEAQRLKAILIKEEERRAEQERQHQQQLRQIEIDRANFLAKQERIRKQRIQEEAERIKAEQEARLREIQQQHQRAMEMSYRSSNHCILS